MSLLIAVLTPKFDAAIIIHIRYSHGKLVEINSHSLFSKWFSESGKLVMRMFQQISELVADEDAFVCVLIDEVESLTAARKAALAGTEPSDAVRVVNALLTQIDKLKSKKNVLILATSNITEAIGNNGKRQLIIRIAFTWHVIWHPNVHSLPRANHCLAH
ncbi:ATPase family associated with various cellular activities-domain-containing protein [Jimgerdemannia flammicorona]|uniref:ATPase family associated with various cellular activities-domain-containing protein n=1 Tax=Jimgerdemannia flammicorona TaxID=994334 RepID=A0A433QWL2_9FUNG|nr:ATPase family associated with various cellular activities-domain-containing protein [Jimgerdemannia flammicorona]